MSWTRQTRAGKYVPGNEAKREVSAWTLGAAMSAGVFSVQTTAVDSIDCLQQIFSGSDVEIVQLARGRLQGSVTKGAFEGLAFAKVECSLPRRSCGTLGTANLTISMLLGSAGRTMSWGHDLGVGDVFLSAPGKTLDAVLGEQTNIAGISIAPQQIASAFASEPMLSDVGYWMQNHRYTCAPHERAAIAARVSEIASWLEQSPILSGTAADFWRRCLIEAFTATSTRSMPPDLGATIPSTVKLVRNVEHYLETHANRAVHVSEICTALGLSRRTLHRAFHDVLGVGPITFLRHHRLCLVHARLRRAKPGQVHVTDVATEFGFLELGRFAQYYMALFGEYPSQTLYRDPRPCIATPAHSNISWPDLSA